MGYAQTSTNSNSSDSIWFQYGLNKYHTNKSTFLGPNKSTVLWKHKITGNVGSSAIDHNNNIYIPNESKIICLSANGSFKWSFSLSSSVRFSPSILKNGNVLVSTSDNKIYCLSSQGKQIWNRSDYHCHTVAGQSIFALTAGTKQTGIAALSLEGKQLWFCKFNHLSGAPPSLDHNGFIYVTTLDGRLIAISPGGKAMWTYSIGSGTRASITGSPSVGSNNTVYFGASDGHLYAVNPDGKLAWKLLVDGRIESNLALGANDTIYFGGMFYNIIAVSKDGKVLWKFRTDGYNFSAPTLDVNDNLYFLTTQHTIYSIDSKGNKRWIYRSKFPDGCILSPAIGPNGQLVIGNFALGN